MQKITLSMPAQKEHNNGKKTMFWNQAQFMSARHFSSFENIKITHVGVPRTTYKGLLYHHVKKSEWVGNETHKLAIDWQIDKKCNSKVNHSQWVQIISEEASVFSKQAFLEFLIIALIGSSDGFANFYSMNLIIFLK